MQGPDPPPTPERSDATGAWHAPTPPSGAGSASGAKSRPAPGSGLAGNDPPTIRSGSSPRRHWDGSVVGYPQPGERIDGFELEEAIGAGGMGAVFRARDARLDRHVALKLLPPEQAKDPEVVQRFYQEGRAAAQLDHENIARVYTIDHDDRYHYIAFEYIEGTTIRQRVERYGPLGVGEAINYTLQIAGALVHAAERGVVHRDIKPSNIIVTPQGRAKLVDMGLARRFERGTDDGLTQSGMTLGTFDYISPEQARDPRDVDVRSDLYSLGCTLFHMLTGRPPFPEGTVLQKLIQHQEEPPPDICALNPQVPPDLATILLKLMAKDRDRRYQAPEQLVRDLLTLAGALGLRSISPEGLVWMSASAPSAWERHLVWGLPALAFLLVMVVLVWWGQDAPPVAPRPPLDVPPRLTVQAAGSRGGEDPDGARPSARDGQGPPAQPGPSTAREVPEKSATTDTPAAPEAAPRDIAVESDEDLLAVLASAPPHSIVVLADDGPYPIGRASTDRHLPTRLRDRDLTLKADAGITPVLRLAHDATVGGRPPGALLDFAGGHVTLEGLEFLVDPASGDVDGEPGPAAIGAEDTELTIRRCRFRRQVDGISDDRDRDRPRAAALHLRATTAAHAAGDRPPATLADACHFDGGLVGVLARGPVDLQLRDCTMGGPDPAIWLENGDPKVPPGTAPEIRLRHDSVIAGAGPVFRFAGPGPRVWIDDTVVAPARDAEVTLIAADDPEGLDWRGRANLYGRIATFLRPGGANARNGRDREAIRDFARWAETATSVRETGSTSTQERAWGEPESAQAAALEGAHPSRAFRLAAGVGEAGLADVGARTLQGPFGALAAAPAAGSRSAAIVPESRRDRDRESRGVPAVEAAPSPSKAPDETPASPPPATTPMPMADPDEAGTGPGVRMPEMPEMPPPGRDREGAGARTANGGEPSRPVEEADPPATESRSEPSQASARPPTSPARGPAPAPAPASAPEPDVLRTVDQLKAELGRRGAGGGTLRVASDADWNLTGLEVRSPGRWTLRAEDGPTRPRIRFRPVPADLKAPTAWSLGIDLRAGALRCEGIDLVLDDGDAPSEGRWGAFGVAEGAELALTNCTVTIEGDGVPTAIVVVSTAHEADPSGPREGPGGGIFADAGDEHAPGPARVLLTDCLLRTGGDLAEVDAGRSLTLELSDDVVVTGGYLVRAHGQSRGLAVEPLRLDLRQVTARMAEGLIRLESSPTEPEVAQAEIRARDSILTTNSPGTPLLQVDGQDDLGAIQNRLRWDGLRVAYHQINAYRRDQSSQVGTVPKLYNRPAWMVAVGPQEESPIHGDLKFNQKWDLDRPAWAFRRDDFRLAPDSPAASTGAELSRIPQAPSNSW